MSKNDNVVEEKENIKEVYDAKTFEALKSHADKCKKLVKLCNKNNE